MAKSDSIVIGVDTGNRCIKTATQTMLAALFESDEMVAFDNATTIEYNGKFYVLGNNRGSYRRNKTVDDNYFVLTLYAIVAELKVRHIPFGKGAPVPKIILAVGLPPAHAQMQGKAFRDYFNRGVVEFRYGGEPVKIEIVDVMVLIQGFSAICADAKMVRDLEVAYIVDIGGYTTDVIGMNRGKVNHEVCISENAGMIHVYNKIKDEMNMKYESVPEEAQIDRLISDPRYHLEGGMKELALRVAGNYVNELMRRLNEKSIDLRLGTGIFVGGGSIRLEKQIVASPFVTDPIFIRSINANAYGYEYAARRTFEGGQANGG